MFIWATHACFVSVTAMIGRNASERIHTTLESEYGIDQESSVTTVDTTMKRRDMSYEDISSDPIPNDDTAEVSEDKTEMDAASIGFQ